MHIERDDAHIQCLEREHIVRKSANVFLERNLFVLALISQRLILQHARG